MLLGHYEIQKFEIPENKYIEYGNIGNKTTNLKIPNHNKSSDEYHSWRVEKYPRPY